MIGLLSKDINLSKTRLKNQADFYSLFGAIAELNRESAHTSDADLVIWPQLEDVGIFDDDKNQQVYKAGQQAAVKAWPQIEKLLLKHQKV